MKHVLMTAALVVATWAPAVQAGEASAVLSQCLTTSATPEDRRALVRWIFSAISVHPDLKELTAIDPSSQKRIEDAAVETFERLIAVECTAQARDAIVREGAEGYASAFEAFGELAMGGVVGDATVQAGMQRLAGQIDEQRILKALLAK